jgi:hypothetical protein
VVVDVVEQKIWFRYAGHDTWCNQYYWGKGGYAGHIKNEISHYILLYVMTMYR